MLFYLIERYEQVPYVTGPLKQSIGEHRGMM